MATHDSENDDFHTKTGDFMSWLKQRPGVTISPKIQIADLRHIGAGRGIVAVEDIEDDEELFSITPKDVLCVENSFLNSSYSELFQQLNPWNSLILAMIYEDGQEEYSEWWPYLKILPTSFDSLMYWSDLELAELQGSAVLQKIGKDTAEKSFIDTLLPIVQKNCHLFGAHAAVFRSGHAAPKLVGLAHRMATLIMAYGFDIENESLSGDGFEEEEENDQGGNPLQEENRLNKGMIPLADMFNADGDLNNAHLLQNEGSMTMIALKPVKKRDQIFNDFGQLPRSDLLRRYGYVTDRYKQWDVVEIDLGAISTATAEYNGINNQEIEQRLRLAAEWEVLQDGYDLCRSTRSDRFDFDDDLILTLTALLLNSTEYEKALATPQVPDQPPAHLHISTYKVLRSIVAKRTNAYHTTIAQDKISLADANISIRHRMAIEVRLGEKEILAMAAQEIDKQLTKLLQAQNEAKSNENAKKRKL